MNFLQIFQNCISRFGFLNGSLLFIKLKLKLFNKLKIPGYKHPVTLRKNGSDHSVFLQIFLTEEYAFDYKSEIKTIIDAGANAGFAAVFFSNKFKKARIISIEPEKGNYKALEKNTASLQNVETVLAALWYDNVKMQLIDNGGEWVYAVKESEDGIIHGISVLDIMRMYNISVIDILKIDIEGSEKELFEKNYTHWLPKTKYLIVETHDRVKENCTKTVFKALENYNFSCHLNGENFIFVNEDIIAQ